MRNLLAGLIFISAVAFSQTGPVTFITVDPTAGSPCSYVAGALRQYNTTTGNLWQCNAPVPPNARGSWAQLGSFPAWYTDGTSIATAANVNFPSSGGGGVSACGSTPPTSGLAHATCYDTSGNIWQCSNGSSACTSTSQWATSGFTYNSGAGTITAVSGANVLIGDTVLDPVAGVSTNALNLNPSGTVAGVVDFHNGTIPASFPANSFSIYGAATIGSAFQWVSPSAAATGFVLGTNVAGTVALSQVVANGTGNVVLSSATSEVSISLSSLGTSPTDALLLNNPTAASVGAPQYSPILDQCGFAERTNGGNTSQAICFRSYVSGSTDSNGFANPRWNLESSVNGGVWSSRMYFDSSSANATSSGLFLQDNLQIAGANLTIPAAGNYKWLGRAILDSPADGKVLLTNSATTGFTIMQFGVTGATGPALSTTIQTNPVISLVDGTGAATANLKIGAQAAATGLAPVCIDTAGNIVKGTLGTCTGN